MRSRYLVMMTMLLVIWVGVGYAEDQATQTDSNTTVTTQSTQVVQPTPIQMTQPVVVQPMQTATQGGQVQSEHLRCTETCNTFTGHYRFRYPQMASHEGDAACWQTCWQRFGGAGTPPQPQMKTFWAERRPLNMKNNLCSQACWRSFHNGSGIAQVANWSSSPRPIERCFGEALRAVVVIPAGATWAAPVTTALTLGPNVIAAVPSVVAVIPSNTPTSLGTPGSTVVPGT